MQLKLPRCKIRRQPEWKNPRLPAPPCNITGIACPTQSCRLPIFFFLPSIFWSISGILFSFTPPPPPLLFFFSLFSFLPFSFSFLFLVSLRSGRISPESVCDSFWTFSWCRFLRLCSHLVLLLYRCGSYLASFPGFSSSYQYFCVTTISSHFPILILSIQNN